MTGAQPPRMTRANPAGSCRIMSGVATSWREAWSCPRTFHDACPHNVLAACSVLTSVMPGRNTFTEEVSRTTWRPCSPHRSASWASPCTTATTWMPLPPESDSQDGSGTGQIWVTSSRPISSGGSSRAAGGGQDPLGDMRVGARYPGGHRAQVITGQGGGVEVAAQVVRGLGGPEGAVLDAVLGDGERERVSPPDGGRGVLAAVDRGPAER